MEDIKGIAANADWFGVSREVEDMARKLCAAAGIDPDYHNPDVGYWSYAIGGRAGPGHAAPKQWVQSGGNPTWLGFYAQAKHLS